MLVVVILVFTLAIGFLFYALGLIGITDKGVKTRLDSGNRVIEPVVDSKKRLIMVSDVKLGITRLVSPRFLISISERNLVLAGRPSGWTLPRMLVAKLVLTAIAVVFVIVLLAAGPSAKTVLMSLALVGIAYVLPDVVLRGRAIERQKQIELDLPDILDQATIAIESGLSFEAALARVGSTAKGPLVEEIVRLIQNMRLGMSRRDAYAEMSARTNVKDLQRFTKSIVQAEEFGVPVANVVRNLAKEMRVKRRYKAEAKALQIPVKMLFPLLVCIFPVLFVVVLFPAFAGLGATLSGSR